MMMMTAILAQEQVVVPSPPSVGRCGSAMAAVCTTGPLSVGGTPAVLPAAPRLSRSARRRRRAAAVCRRLWLRTRWQHLCMDEGLGALELAVHCTGGLDLERDEATALPSTGQPSRAVAGLAPVGALVPHLASGLPGMPRTVALLARGWLPYLPVNLAWHVCREYGVASLHTDRAAVAGHRAGAVELHEVDMAVEDYADAELDFCPDIGTGDGITAEAPLLQGHSELPWGAFVFGAWASDDESSVGEDVDSEAERSSLSSPWPAPAPSRPPRWCPPPSGRSPRSGRPPRPCRPTRLQARAACSRTS